MITNTKLHKFMNNYDGPVYLLRHENLCANQGKEITQIQKFFGLEWRSQLQTLELHAYCIGAPLRNSGLSDFPFDASYYLEKRYMEHLSHEDVQKIKDHIPAELLEFFGYQIECG